MFVLSCLVWPTGLEIDTRAGTIQGFVAAAANGNVASDCLGSAVVPGYSDILCSGLRGPGEQVTLWLSEGRWEDVELACWCLLVHVGKQDGEKGAVEGSRKERVRFNCNCERVCFYCADKHYHRFEKEVGAKRRFIPNLSYIFYFQIR